MRLPSKSAAAELVKLGRCLAVARKRRRMTQKNLAEAAGLTIPTVNRLEKGHPGVSVGALAMTFLALGELYRLGSVLASENDDIGLVISVNSLPKRVRTKKIRGNPSNRSSEGCSPEDQGPYMSF